MATRSTYEILMTGSWSSDEGAKLREAGWIWTPVNNHGCERCGRGPAYLKDGICLGCRRDQYARADANWSTDERLAAS